MYQLFIVLDGEKISLFHHITKKEAEKQKSELLKDFLTLDLEIIKEV